MTVNTSSLLNFLKPSINDTIKNKIEILSKDGKLEITTLLKDKSTSSLLNSLFKDILQGIKTKNNVNEALKNSKAMFDFKNISSDINELINKTNQNPKLVKQTTGVVT